MKCLLRHENLLFGCIVVETQMLRPLQPRQEELRRLVLLQHLDKCVCVSVCVCVCGRGVIQLYTSEGIVCGAFSQ